jgi:hypothetical protein
MNEFVARNGVIAQNNSVISGSLIVTGGITGSLLGSATSASYAATASSADDFTVRSTLTAQTLVVQTITSSITYSSGSNIFGNALSNTQKMTGSVSITGSLGVNGNVGVNITNPTFAAGGGLAISNATRSNLNLTDGTNTFSLFQNGVDNYINNLSTGDVIIRTTASNVERFRILNGGAARFSSTVNVSGSLSVGLITPSATVGRIDASNDIVAFSTSDERLKENIIPIANALDKINKIGGYTFSWKTEEDLVRLHGFTGNDVGVIAQQIMEVLPEVVTTRESGYMAVKYEKLIPLLIEGIKAQQIEINELKELIKNKL